MNRRRLLAGMAAMATPVGIAAPALSQQRSRSFRMLLNTSVSGPQAWFYLAQDRGYLAAEGLDITFVPGGDAYTAAPRMHRSDFDFGYGGITATLLPFLQTSPSFASD